MRVTMKATISGTRDGADWPAVGEVVHLPDAEAEDMIAAGLAVPAPAPEPEKATAPKPRSKRPAAESR
jgi:hypothetical protein